MLHMNSVIYLRSGRRDDAAIELQRSICQELATQLKATIDAEFVDNGMPDKTTDRPGLRALFDYLERVRTDLVIMTHGYRLARKANRYLELVSQIGSFGTTIITQDKHVYIFGGKRS